MNFVAILHDKSEEGTIEKRLSVRDVHLEGMAALRQSGNLLKGGPILNDDGAMVGSFLLTEFDTQEQLEAIIKQDIYYREDVWDHYEIYPVKLPV